LQTKGHTPWWHLDLQNPCGQISIGDVKVFQQMISGTETELLVQEQK